MRNEPPLPAHPLFGKGTLAELVQGPTTKPPRIILLGAEKVGKSTFASQAPAAIVVPILGEEGIDSLPVPRVPAAQTFAQVLSYVTMLATQEHAYETVVIDSVSALEPLVWDHVCSKHGWEGIESPGYGKGYIEALGAWRELVRALDVLREQRSMGSILIGHVRVKTANDPMLDPYDTNVLDIHDKAASVLYRWADSILFASRKGYTRTVDPKGNKKTVRATSVEQHVLYTQGRLTHPGGGRGVFGALPYELPLSWAAFASAIEAANQTNTNTEPTNG